MTLNRDLTLWTYQYTDGSNQTTVMYNYNFKKDNIGVTLGAGIDTDFDKRTGFIADGKVNIGLGKHTSIQFRARTRNGEDYNKFQGRIAVTGTFKVAQGTSIYITPYGALNVDCNTGVVKPNLGAFAGINYDINKQLLVGAEVQRYNLQEPMVQDGNWSVNGKIAYKF